MADVVEGLVHSLPFDCLERRGGATLLIRRSARKLLCLSATRFMLCLTASLSAHTNLMKTKLSLQSLALLLLLTATASAGALDGTAWTVQAVPTVETANKGAKRFDDVLTFAGGKFPRKNCSASASARSPTAPRGQRISPTGNDAGFESEGEGAVGWSDQRTGHHRQPWVGHEKRRDALLLS